MDRNAVSDEALTSVTASTFLKLQWVTDQINDDHIDAEENRFEESAIYALFITNEPNQLQWVTNQINDDHNDAEENTLEENLGQNPLRQNPLGQNPLGHNPRWTKSPRSKSPRTKSP